jgi:hypothetical protein
MNFETQSLTLPYVASGQWRTLFAMNEDRKETVESSVYSVILQFYKFRFDPIFVECQVTSGPSCSNLNVASLNEAHLYVHAPL